MVENIQPVLENRVPFGEAIKNTFGGVGGFLSGLFQLNPKSAAVVSCGVFLGVLAGMPIIGWAGILWAVIFGAFTAFLYIQRSPQPAQYTDGVVLGAITGTIGSFIQLGFSLVFSVIYLMYDGLSNAVQPRQQDPWGFPNQGMETFAAYGTSAYLIFSSLAFFIPIILMAILGGLLGVVWFESRVSDSARVSSES